MKSVKMFISKDNNTSSVIINALLISNSFKILFAFWNMILGKQMGGIQSKIEEHIDSKKEFYELLLDFFENEDEYLSSELINKISNFKESAYSPIELL